MYIRFATLTLSPLKMSGNLRFQWVSLHRAVVLWFGRCLLPAGILIDRGGIPLGAAVGKDNADLSLSVEYDSAALGRRKLLMKCLNAP